jgi:hypothetical protein
MDHVQPEDDRDVQPRLQGGLLDLVDVVDAHQVQDRSDFTALDLVEKGLSRRAVRAGGAGHLQLPEFLRKGHLADQRIDLAGDRRQPLPGRGRFNGVRLLAEVRAARLPAALVLAGPAVAAGTASSATAASAMAPEAICATPRRRRGLRIIARPPCHVGDGPTATCPQPVKPVC